MFSMDADGSHQRRLTDERARSRDASAYSPSGRKIVYVRDTSRDTNLYVMDADGSGQARAH